MIRVDNDLVNTTQVRDFLRRADVISQLRPITMIEARSLGLLAMHTQEALLTMRIVEMGCNRGEGIVVLGPAGAQVQILDEDGRCVAIEVYLREHLDREEGAFYYQAVGTRPGGFTVVRRVAEEDLDDTTFTAVCKTPGFVSEVEADQWYSKDGYLRLFVSGKYPPHVLAGALFAAYKALRDEADIREGGADPAVSRA